MLPGPVATAMAVVEVAREERFTEVRDRFAPQLRPLVSAGALQAAWTAEADRLGPVSSVGPPVSEPAGAGVVVVKVPVAFEREGLTVMVLVSEAGWLTGLQLAPAEAARPTEPWEPPSYADPTAFEEHDVTVGAGPLSVPGTLSLPHRRGPLPGIVQLPGSGPLDRDGTVGRNKPLKDVAWGLASRGVAVLRFDKVTYAHSSEVRAARDFTLSDEYVPHAVAALHILRLHPAVDPRHVFLLGHSLGGTVAPRVAAGEPSVAGLVILAGGTVPLHWTLVRQLRHLASLDPETAAAAQPVIDAITEQAQRVDAPDLSPSTPAEELPFGMPAPYWLDVRAYYPVGVAASLGKPILVLQGGPRLPGNRGRRPRQMGSGPRSPSRRDRSCLSAGQPLLLPRDRPIGAAGVRAGTARGAGGRRRRRELADPGLASCRSPTAAQDGRRRSMLRGLSRGTGKGRGPRELSIRHIRVP
jgi:dienelactone hydrolase